MQPPDSPLFSIVIPTWHRADVLGRAIESLLRQTLSRFEVIVVDDGPDGATRSAIERFGDPRLQYVPQRHAGVCTARNRGASLARAPLLTFLDSDDEANPDWLESFAEALQDGDVALACCGVTHQLASTSRTIRPSRQGGEMNEWHSVFLAGSFALRRQLFVEVGGYWEVLAHGENTELGLRLAEYCEIHGGRCAAIDRPLVVYHCQRPRDHLRKADAVRARLESSQHLLSRHRTRLRRNPPLLANFLATAGVRAARLEKMALARAFFLDAVRVNPTTPKHFARLALSLFPLVARWFWRKADPSSPPS